MKHFQQQSSPSSRPEEEAADDDDNSIEGGNTKDPRLALRVLRWKCARRAEPYARRLLRTAHRLFKLKRELERAAGDIAGRRYETEHIVALDAPSPAEEDEEPQLSIEELMACALRLLEAIERVAQAPAPPKLPSEI